MCMEDLFFTLFTEAYLRYFLLPLDTQIVLPAMDLFGGYDMLLPNLITGVGILLAMASSFIIGMGLARLREQHFSHVLGDERYGRISRWTSRYGWPFLLLVGLPLGTLIPAVLGFFFKKQYFMLTRLCH